MAGFDIFENDAFRASELSAALDKAPHKPKLLGTIPGLWEPQSHSTTIVEVEERQGTLALINSAARGSQRDVRTAPKRKMQAFRITHVPYFQGIQADDIQNLRAFGSLTELEVVARYINDQLIGMRRDHEATQEYHRLGSLKGVILDADGGTVADLLTDFGVSQSTEAWTYATAGGLNQMCINVTRTIATKLGNDTFGQIYVLCGDTFFDKVVSHADIKDGYDRWMDGGFRRMQHIGPDWYSLSTNGFMYQNLFFVNYRAKVGTTSFLAANTAIAFPTNVDGMYIEAIGPADMMPYVNTPGQRFYASQEMLPHQKGLELHTQHNILYLNTRPSVPVLITGS